ncbi:MAG: hypothetical protein ABTQ32_13415 [Myxococcaceae bacterium]
MSQPAALSLIENGLVKAYLPLCTGVNEKKMSPRPDELQEPERESSTAFARSNAAGTPTDSAAGAAQLSLAGGEIGVTTSPKLTAALEATTMVVGVLAAARKLTDGPLSPRHGPASHEFVMTKTDGAKPPSPTMLCGSGEVVA